MSNRAAGVVVVDEAAVDVAARADTAKKMRVLVTAIVEGEEAVRATGKYRKNGCR